MLSRPETRAQLHARIGREIDAASARVRASRSDLLEHIVRTRTLITESRELMARVDVILADDGHHS